MGPGRSPLPRQPGHRALSARGWLLALWLGLLASAAQGAGVEVRTLDGATRALGDYVVRDRWTLFMVWTTYCAVCREQYPLISRFQREHGGRDAEVVGIALDGYAAAAAVAAYREKQDHAFPSVLAEADTFADRYSRTTGEAFTGTPTYLLFDPAGRLHGFIGGPVTLAALQRSMASWQPPPP